MPVVSNDYSVRLYSRVNVLSRRTRSALDARHVHAIFERHCCEKKQAFVGDVRFDRETGRRGRELIRTCVRVVVKLSTLWEPEALPKPKEEERGVLEPSLVRREERQEVWGRRGERWGQVLLELEVGGSRRRPKGWF